PLRRSSCAFESRISPGRFFCDPPRADGLPASGILESPVERGGDIMKTSPMPFARWLLGAAALALVVGVSPAPAATPKDTLVIVWAMDDIITMDPAESFEISAGEIMGNTYDRLLRFDVADPSKLMGDIAKTWTVSPDGKTYTFELKDGLKFASD